MREFERRRLLIASCASVMTPWLAMAQTAKRPPVVGILGLAAPSKGAPVNFAALLEKFGLQKGRDFVLDVRYSGGDDAKLPTLATELVSQGASIIVAVSTRASIAAKRATRSVPIVFIAVGVPVENGLVASLARPGGNVTGATWDPPEIAGKKLEVIREAVPGVKRVALLWNPEYPGQEFYGPHGDRAATSYGIELKHFDVVRRGDLARALKQIAAYRPDALYVVPIDEIALRIGEVVAFAREYRIVSFGATPAWTASGGVLYYGPVFAEVLEQGASYVARILRGARPADLPVEMPRRYELVVNVKAAKAIGYKIPASLLARADRVIE